MNVAVVGSNRGIGLALVKELKKQGAEVYAFCREASEDLKDSQPKNIIEGFEVTVMEKMKSKISENDLPTFDQVYHVSGIMRSSTLAEFDVQGIKEQFEVNSVAPILCAKAFLPKLKENSKIGLLTSRMGSIEDNDSGGSYGYRMSKAALNAAGKSLSIDLKEQGISVFLLHPGWVKTDMTSQSGLVETDESAKNLVKIMNEKSLQDTGSFWHMNGEPLPW